MIAGGSPGRPDVPSRTREAPIPLEAPVADSPLAVRHPTSVLRVWGADGARDQVREAVLGGCQAVEVGPDALAIVPEPGDPGVFDAGLHWSRRVLSQLEVSPDGPRVLISPAEVLLRGREVLGVHDEIADEVGRRAPTLKSNDIYLTTWAAQTLETSWDLQASGSYRGPSGREFPLVRAMARVRSRAPWRNPEILGREVESTPRPELEAVLAEHLHDPVIRVTGPAGCGKTRLVWETLERSGAIFLWLQAQPERRGGLSLSQQVVDELLDPHHAEDPHRPVLDPERRRALQERDGPAENQRDSVLSMLAACEPADRPLYLVCDDFEQIQEEDLELLLRLSNARLPGRRLHLVLVGRGGVTGRSGFEGTFSLRVPAFEGEETVALTDRLLSGLSLPEDLSASLVKATGGHPFALEEGLVALVRSKVMRSIYGNYFFVGSESTDFQPSARLVCHLQAEAGRLGASDRLILLSLADTPVPSSVLTVASGRVEPDSNESWATAALEAGMLRRVPSPWGVGLEFTCPAYARALALSAPDETRETLRGRLGRALQAVSNEGEQLWYTYRLLEGTKDGVPPLLRTARSPYARELAGETLYEALTSELALHRERDGDDETELLLIWRLLGVARRLGKLRHLIPDLERGLELASADSDKALALSSLMAAAYEESGNYRRAEKMLLTALEETSLGDQPQRRARLALQLGAVYERAGRLSEASRLLEDLYPALERQKHHELAASCHFTLGEIALRLNRLEEAITHHRSAYETRKKLGKQSLTASLTALGRVSHAAGNYPQALDYFEEALQSVTDRTSEECARVLLGTATVLRRLGDYTHAAALSRRALKIHEAREDAVAVASARLALARTHADLEQYDKALAQARQVQFEMDLLSMSAELADAEQLVARIEISRRRYDDAGEYLERALAQHREAGNSRGAAVDHALAIGLGIATEDGSMLRQHTAELEELLPDLHHSSEIESLNYRMYEGLSWLRLHDAKVEDPRKFLEQAYAEVLRKAFPLDPEQRHHYLFEVADNRAIVEQATREGLEAPPIGSDN